MFQYSVFYGEYENIKKKGQKNLTFPDGDLNPGFQNQGFPAQNLNFEEDQFNRARVSYNLSSTLRNVLAWDSTAFKNWV